MQLRSRDALIICLEATGMSERHLARVAGLGHATVNHLITGRRTRCSPATALAIEKALGCEDGTLFEGPRPTDTQWRPFGGHSRQHTPLRVRALPRIETDALLINPSASCEASRAPFHHVSDELATNG